MSQMESTILRSKMPIEIEESEEITVLGQRGIWANKAEQAGWTGNTNESLFKSYHTHTHTPASN